MERENHAERQRLASIAPEDELVQVVPPPAEYSNPLTDTEHVENQALYNGPPVFDEEPVLDEASSTSEIYEEDGHSTHSRSDSENESHGHGSSSISRDTTPILAARGGPANLLNDQHLQRNPHRFHAGVNKTWFGIRSTTTPGVPMALNQAGPALTPLHPVTPAGTNEIAPPPPASPVTGVRKNKTLKAVKTFVAQLLPQSILATRSHGSRRSRTNLEEMLPSLTRADGLGARVQSLFHAPEGDTSATELAQKLNAALDPANPHTLAPANNTELGFTHHALIAERLAQVTGGDAPRALTALDALTQGRFLPFHTVDFGNEAPPERLETLIALPRNRESRAQPQLDALSVAAKLGESPTGYEALTRALQPQLPDNRQPHFKRLLEAIAKVEAERGAAADVALHTITARGALDTNQATLAQHVLHIESHALESVDEDPHALLSAADKAAIFSWDNGFRERGPGSDLAKVQGRLAKMGKYVQRANHLQNLRNVRFDRNAPLRSGAKVVDAKARIFAMRAQQTVGRKKSPLTGMRTFGAINNWLMHPDEDPPILDNNAKVAVKLLRHHLQKSIGSHADYAVQLADTRSRNLPKPVLREAVLEHWESQFETGNMRPLGLKLDDAAVKQIAEKIAVRYGVDREATRSQIETQLRQWTGTRLKRHGFKLNRKVSRELTVGDLKRWAKDANMPLRMHTPLGAAVAGGASPQEAAELAAASPEHDGATGTPTPAGSPTYIQETEFAEALRRSLAVVNAPAVRADDLTPDGLHRYTRTYLLEHNWGNPLVASNGGSAGINTGSISESIHKLAKKVLPASVVPSFDLRISRTNNAVMNIGSSTHGGEIFIGTQRQKAASFGVGVSASIGPGVLKHILGQAAGNAEITPLAYETVKTRGVMVRSLRPEKADRSGFDTAAARGELVKFNDLIWSIAKGEHDKDGNPVTPEQSWELIADQFFKSPTLSIGWQEQDADTLHHGYNTSVGVRAGHTIGKWIARAFTNSEVERAAVNVGFAGDLTTLGSNRRREESGKNRNVRANHLWRFQKNMTAGVTLTNPPIPLSHATGAVTASMASGPTSVTHTFALDDRGFNATFRAIIKAGKLSEPFTLREFEERDAKAYVNFLHEPSRRAQFTQVFKAAYGDEHGQEEFDNFLTKTKNWAGPAQHFVARYRVRTEDRKILDELAAVAHATYERNPNDPELPKIERAMKSRLEDEDTWVPAQLFSLEQQTARDTLGLNFGVQFSATEAVSSDRELTAVSVPLPIADEWTRLRKEEWRRGEGPYDSSVRQTAEDHTAGV
ncbi:hypothetical protein [Paraburkholderia phosphatilytica]|uniref:hypothetical protein n=1 Tax=Paraburkholderia phosphatilytica TaxID=2282883 RepID=UPI000F5E251F|nr:hypothetical protein [Paraburkholderia phosphatilytica]